MVLELIDLCYCESALRFQCNVWGSSTDIDWTYLVQFLVHVVQCNYNTLIPTMHIIDCLMWSVQP